jgi:transposase InsO family protein
MAVAEDVAERLIALRRSHPTWGGKKLVVWLETHEPWWLLPAASTTTALLKRHGLVKARRRTRDRSPLSAPLAHADAPNAVWCVDFKGDFLLGDGTRCYPLTVTDAFSRAALCCRALTSTHREPVQAALERTFREWGLPLRLRSDNGQPFRTPKGGTISQLGVWLVKLGIVPEYISPGKPQENGRHERFHRTLKAETCIPPSHSLRAQQRRFDIFRREYNDDRPHEALGQLTPMNFHFASYRQFPKHLESPIYPADYELRRIDRAGTLRWRGRSLYIGQGLVNEEVGLVEVELDTWEIYFGPILVGRLHDALLRAGVVQPAWVSPMSSV